MIKIRALTLVELIVAIGITVLILAVSLPLFKYDKGEALVQNEAELVLSYLETARSLAIHPENENASAYKVSWGTNDIVNTSVVVGSVETIDDDKKLTLNYSRPSVAGNISFASYLGEYSGDAKDIKLCLKNNDSVCKTVWVTKPGVINILPW